MYDLIVKINIHWVNNLNFCDLFQIESRTFTLKYWFRPEPLLFPEPLLYKVLVPAGTITLAEP